MRQNVVLIVFDTARRDAFEPFGGATGSTPAFGQLARRGNTPSVRSAANWTVPSHAAMFSGLLPRATGTSHPTGDNLPRTYARALTDLQDRLLPEILRRSGFDTRAVSTNLWLTPASGFDRGFEVFETVDTARQSRLDATTLRERIAWRLEGIRAGADDGAGATEEIIRRWLREDSSKPFFWFVNLVEAHSPYLPPKPYNDLGPLDRARAADEAREYLNMVAIWRACVGGLTVPEDALARMRHLYARSIRLLDDWLARVLDAFDAAGMLDDTLFLVTSDHGENIGEAGLMGHAFSLDDRLLRVPFAAAGPGSDDFRDMRSLIELPARIARATEVQAPEWEAGLPRADQVTLAQFDPPAPRDHPKVAGVIESWGLGREAELKLTAKIDCAVTDDWKLVVEDGRERFIDLRNDLLEIDEVSASDVPSQIVTALREALDDPTFREDHDPGAAAEPAPTSAISDEERDALEERMRLLGYL